MVNKRTLIKMLVALPFVGKAFAESSLAPVGKYDAVMKAFPEGTWVFGIGEHAGCSQTFDYKYPDRPQPFAWLDATNPNDFRLATREEVIQAYLPIHRGDLPDE